MANPLLGKVGGAGSVGGPGSFRRSGGSGGGGLGPDASAEDVQRALAAMRTEEYIRNFTGGGGEQTVEQRTAQALARLLAPNPAADPRLREAGEAAIRSGISYDPETGADLGVADISRIVTLAGRGEMAGWAERNLAPVARAAEVLNRPQQAMMEVIQAASYDTGLNKVLENGLGNDSGDALTPTAKGSLGSGGYRDAIRALRGQPRWDPSSAEWTHNLDYSEALGMDRRGRKDNALGKVEGVADFVGGAALDPLNFVGGGTKAAANAVQKTAVRDVLSEVGEEGLSDALAKTLARQGAAEATPEALEAALRRTGLRRGLTDAQRATLRDVLVAEREAGAQTSGRLSGRVRTLTSRSPEKAADNLLDQATRYDRGGLRIAGRSLTPEGLRSPARDVLRGRTQELGDTVVSARVLDRVPELRERLVAVMDRKGELADKAAARHAALLERRITKPEDALETAAERAYSNLIDAKAAVPDGNIQVTDELRSAMTELSYRLDEAVSKAATGRVADNDWLPFASSMLGEYADTARNLIAEDRFDDLLTHFETAALPKAGMLPTWAIIGNARAREIGSEARAALRAERKAGWDARRDALRAVKAAKKELDKATQAAVTGTKVDRKVLKRLEADYQRALRYQAEADATMARIDALDAASTAAEAVAAEPALVNVADPVRQMSPGVVGPAGTRVGNRVTRKVQEALVPRATIGWSESLPAGVSDSVYDASSGSLATANAYKSSVAGQIRAAGQRAGQIDDGLRRAALEALEGGPEAVADLRAALPPEQAQWLDTLEKVRDADSALQRSKGLMDPAKMRDKGYMLHEMTPEGKRAFDEAMNASRYEVAFSKYRGVASGARTAAAQRGSLLPRVLRDKTVWEIEEELGGLLRQEGLLEPGQALMITDPEELIVRRADRTAKALQQAEYLDELSKTKGILGEDLLIRVRPGQKAPRHATGMIRHSLGEGGEIIVHPDLAEHVIPYFDMLQTDDLAKGFGRFLDQWQRLWKTYATIPFGIGAGFTVKNGTGNVVANYVRGLTNPAWYVRAARMQRAMSQARKAFPDLPVAEALERGGIAANDIAKIDKMLEDGVLDEKFFSIDLEENITTDALSRTRPLSEKVRNKIDPRRVWKNPAEGLGAQSGRAVNAWVEDNARLAHWLWKFDSTGDARLAAQSVKETLFDYGDLTPFERKVMRRINAFYTFTRKNVPLQVQELVRNPAGLNRVSQGEEFLLGGDEPGDPDTPDYLLSSGGYAARGGLAGLLTGNDNSAIVNVETPFEAAVDQLDPLIRTARFAQGDADAQKIAASLIGNFSGGPAEAVKQVAETATGSSTFTGSSLKDQSGDYKMNPLWRGTQAFIPATGKIANLTGLGKRQTNPLQIRAFRLLTGIQANEVTDEMTEAEKERKLDELYGIIDALKAQGVDVPTVSELRALGILKDKAN